MRQIPKLQLAKPSFPLTIKLYGETCPTRLPAIGQAFIEVCSALLALLPLEALVAFAKTAYNK